MFCYVNIITLGRGSAFVNETEVMITYVQRAIKSIIPYRSIKGIPANSTTGLDYIFLKIP